MLIQVKKKWSKNEVGKGVELCEMSHQAEKYQFNFIIISFIICISSFFMLKPTHAEFQNVIKIKLSPSYIAFNLTSFV